MDYTITTHYQIGNKLFTSNEQCEDFELLCDITDHHIRVDITPIHPIHHFTIDIKLELYQSFDLFFSSSLISNGLSREYKRTDKICSPPRIMRDMTNASNTKTSPPIDCKKSGQFISYTMCYFRDYQDPNITLFGSTDESKAYTTFFADINERTLTISRSFDGITLNTKQNIVDILITRCEYNSATNKYLAALSNKYQENTKHNKIPLYYNTSKSHNNIIDEECILKDANYILAHNMPYKAILIEDGYALNNTDWLYQDKRLFPSGIKGLVDKLHDIGLKVGLWICPTLASPQSKIATLHQDWLVKHNNKSLVVSNFWGGANALDITKPAVKEYISKLFDNIYNDFGCDFIKADNIFAACAHPICDQTSAMLCDKWTALLKQASEEAGKGLILSGAPIYNSIFNSDMLSICAGYNGKHKDVLAEILHLDRNSARYVANSYIFKYFWHNMLPLDYVDLPAKTLDKVIVIKDNQIDICATYQNYIRDKNISF